MTPSFFYPDPSRVVFGHKSLTYMENDMAKYIASTEVMPVLLPDVEDRILNNILAEMDGFVLSGGTDMAPSSYKEEGIENYKWPGDPIRDAYELKVLDFAYTNHKPVFGICRGLQVINVYFEGSLYQDITTQTGSPEKHRCPDEYDKRHHTVDVVGGSLISKLYENAKTLRVNSVHHQAVKALGKNLVVNATSCVDGLVEACTHSERDNIFAVQWHPEFSHTLGDLICSPTPLLNHFLQLVRKKK